MSETNKIVNQETGEIINQVAIQEKIVEETDQYVVKQLPSGEFKKEMKYQQYFSHVPETQEEQIELYNLFNDEDNDSVIPLSRMVKEEIGIDRVYQRPYQSFDEKTGVNTNGVTTYIKDGDTYYATSSKTVYHKLREMFQAFGYPNEETYKKLYVKVTGTKRDNGVQIGLSLSRIG